MNQNLDLDGGRLHALVHPLALDGRQTSHPVTARGWTSTNCYVLVEDDRALLWSTGFSYHQDALLGALDGLVGERPLALAIPRVEFVSMCNARPVADRFAVDVVHQQMRLEPERFLDFRPDVAGGDNGLRGVRRTGIAPGLTLPAGAAGARAIDVIEAPLQLLPLAWGYDAATRALFTCDAFSWATAAGPEGPWLCDDADAVLRGDALRETLVGSRYWWLPGADVDPIRRALDRLFAERDVAIIAPDHGPVLRGAAVAAARAALDDALVALAAEPPVGVGAGAWTLAGAR